MSKYMCLHTLKGLTKDQYEQLAKASQKDSSMKCLHSYANLSEGRLLGVWEASSEQLLRDWFKNMNIECESLYRIELEQEGSNILAA